MTGLLTPDISAQNTHVQKIALILIIDDGKDILLSLSDL